MRPCCQLPAIVGCPYPYVTEVTSVLASLLFLALAVVKCRLSWLTNSALVYEKCGVPANEYWMYSGSKTNFGDLTPYLTYGY
jgi:hypothetical protein